MLSSNPFQDLYDLSIALSKQVADLTELVQQGALIEVSEPKEDLLTRTQAATLLQVHPSTLWAWEKQQRIKCYKYAGKNYYKRSELLDGLTKKQ